MFALYINSEDYCISETFGLNLISSTIPRLSTRSFKEENQSYDEIQSKFGPVWTGPQKLVKRFPKNLRKIRVV